MAFVVGEMGVGKTRLSEEILDLARDRGCNVLVGRTGQANSDLAYAPFLSAFGSYLRRLPAVQREPLLDGLAHLGRLWPDLSPVPPPPLSDPELDRTLLFESVARLLERVAADTPAVILLDDLHWADGGSLALLSYLTHDLEEIPVLVLATYRPEGLARSRAAAAGRHRRDPVWRCHRGDARRAWRRRGRGNGGRTSRCCRSGRSRGDASRPDGGHPIVRRRPRQGTAERRRPGAGRRRLADHRPRLATPVPSPGACATSSSTDSTA